MLELPPLLHDSCFAIIIFHVFAIQWELVTVGSLKLVLVMVLNRADFMKEIDESVTQLGIVMSFAGPSIIVLSFASMYLCFMHLYACLRWHLMLR